jgi:hypothetical protein
MSKNGISGGKSLFAEMIWRNRKNNIQFKAFELLFIYFSLKIDESSKLNLKIVVSKEILVIYFKFFVIYLVSHVEDRARRNVYSLNFW